MVEISNIHIVGMSSFDRSSLHVCDWVTLTHLNIVQLWALERVTLRVAAQQVLKTRING